MHTKIRRYVLRICLHIHACTFSQNCLCIHEFKHARTQARTHARTHANTHTLLSLTHTHTLRGWTGKQGVLEAAKESRQALHPQDDLQEDATLDQEASMRRHAHPHPTLDAEPESKVSQRE
jgi:hypothetical protein